VDIALAFDKKNSKLSEYSITKHPDTRPPSDKDPVEEQSMVEQQIQCF